LLDGLISRFFPYVIGRLTIIGIFEIFVEVTKYTPPNHGYILKSIFFFRVNGILEGGEADLLRDHDASEVGDGVLPIVYLLEGYGLPFNLELGGVKVVYTQLIREE
jgi:hypothetical protein